MKKAMPSVEETARIQNCVNSDGDIHVDRKVTIAITKPLR